LNTTPDTGRDAALGLSIVICTHNGAARLEPTLRHIAAQRDIGTRAWEVVLVDNASTDATAEMAQILWAVLGAPAPLRVVQEPKLGVGHARHTGVHHAAQPIISFVDDDNWICEHWIATLLDRFGENPAIDVIACWSKAAFAEGIRTPAWFTALQHGYAVGPQGKATGWVSEALPRYPTAGLSFRRQAFVDLFAGGFTSLLSGRTGTALSAGEDAEYCYGLALNGCRFWYEESIHFSHFMPQARLTVEYAERLYRGLGHAAAIEDLYQELSPARGGVGAQLKRNDTLRRAVSWAKMTGYRLKARLNRDQPEICGQARIEAAYFAGRLETMREQILTPLRQKIASRQRQMTIL
jgi:glycosyltransferase involved in cell wall biosynthesis